MKEQVAVSMAGLMLLTAGFENAHNKSPFGALVAKVQTTKSKKATPQDVGEKNIYGEWQGRSNPSLHRGGVLLRGDFLYWRADQEGLEYAVKSTLNSTIPRIKSHILKPEVEWSPGFRAGIGYTFATQDFWDVMALWTHFQTHHSDHESVNLKTTDLQNSPLIVPWWGATILGSSANSASVHWNLNYNTYDLDLGRNYFVAKTFSVHPFLGLRGATINQHYHAKYNAFSTQTLLFTRTSFHAETDFWGIGAHVGTALQWRCNRFFSFIGNLGGSLLYADFKIHERYRALIGANPTQITKMPLREHITTGAFNVEAMLGFEWEKFFYENKYRLSIAAGYEWSEWFSQNRLTKVDVSTELNPPAGTPDQFHKTSGNLSLQGANLQVRWDF